MNLRLQTFSAIRWTSAASIGKTLLGLIQIAILARLLAPANFGLMALAFAVIAFVQIFADLGVSNAVIHHQNASQSELSTLFWLNILTALALMLLLMLFSPWIASFYGASDLRPLLVLASLSFPIVALAQLLRALAERDLRFSELAFIDLVAALLGLVAAVGSALIEPNVYALVTGSLVTSTAGAILTWSTLAEGWRPDLRIGLPEVRKFLGFGGYVMANNMVNMANAQADLIIGGRYLSSAALGLFSMPRDLSLRITGLINPIVTRVGLPVMAKVQQDKARLNEIYLKVLRMTASVNFPAYAALALFAPEVIAILLGPQWKEAEDVLRLLALWGMMRSTANTLGSLLFATGRPDLAFKWNVSLTVIVIPGVWLGAQYGVIGLALALNLLIAILLVPGWYFLARQLCGATCKEYFTQLLIPLLTTSIAGGFAYAAVMPFTNMWLRLMIGLVVGGVVYLLTSKWMNRSWFDAMAELILRRQPAI